MAARLGPDVIVHKGLEATGSASVHAPATFPEQSHLDNQECSGLSSSSEDGSSYHSNHISIQEAVTEAIEQEQHKLRQQEE